MLYRPLSKAFMATTLLTTPCLISPISAETTPPHMSMSVLYQKMEDMKRELDALKDKEHGKEGKQDKKEPEATLPTATKEAEKGPKTASIKAIQLQPSKMIYEKFDTAIRVGARVKADFYMDTHGKQSGSTCGLDEAGLVLDQVDFDAQRKANFNTSLASSRFSFDVKKQFNAIESYGYIEIDFNGNASRTTNSYTPRLRHAYGELSNKGNIDDLIIGQTCTNFATLEATPWTTNNVPASFRQAQIRYTRKILECLKLSVSAERPNTQYFQNTAPITTSVSTTTGYRDNDSSDGNSKSVMPDLTFKLQYQKGTTMLALRGVVRNLEVRTITGNNSAINPPYFKKLLGWGLGASAVIRIFKPVAAMLQVQGGKGIGRYIDNLPNSNPVDSYFQYPTSSSPRLFNYFDTLRQYSITGGFTINWTDTLESNLGAVYTKVGKPTKLDMTIVNIPTLHKKMQRYYANLVYTYVQNSHFVLEINQASRSAGYPLGFRGKDTRVIFSYIHNF